MSGNTLVLTNDDQTTRDTRYCFDTSTDSMPRYWSRRLRLPSGDADLPGTEGHGNVTVRHDDCGTAETR